MFGSIPLWQSIGWYLLFIWTYVWTGVALWRAAQLRQRNWFIVILIINVFGILAIIYLFGFCKKRLKVRDIADSLQNLFSSSKR